MNFDKSNLQFMKLFILFLFIFFPTIKEPAFSNELTLEEEINNAFVNYPFKCNEEGSTPEIAACVWIDLIKSDRALREELNDKALYSGWIKYRDQLRNHFQNKMLRGDYRQITRPSCAIRVNKEIQILHYW